MTHPALAPGSVAVVTGGAAGIGLAAAKAFAGLGLNILGILVISAATLLLASFVVRLGEIP